MREKGRKLSYHDQLVIIFVGVALVVSAFAILAGVLGERYVRAAEEHANQSLEEVSSYMLSSRIGEIETLVDYLSTNSTVLDWLESPIGSSDYYYNGLLVYQELVRRTPVLSSDSYNIALARQEEDSFIITSGGTFGKDDFLAYVTPGLDSLPEDGGIALSRDDGLLVLTTRRFLSGDVLTVYCTIPVGALSLPGDASIQVAFVDEYSGHIASPCSDFAQALLQVDPPAMPEGHSEVAGYSIRKEYYPYFGFSALFAHRTGVTWPMMLIVLAVPVVISLSLLVAYKIQKRLYRPVKKAYETLVDEGDEAKGANEFDTIIAKCLEADQIRSRLASLTAELQNATDVQKYRSYLRGQDSLYRAEDDSEAYFCLAILAPVDEDTQTSLFLKMNSMSRRERHLHFIITDKGSGVLIYKTDSAEGCYDYLYQTLKSFTALDEENGLQAAISPSAQGWRQLPQLFRLAMEIMDCRYLLGDRIILTQGDIVGHTNLMHYPISEERKLVNAALSGSQGTLAIFDQIVRENSAPERLLQEKEMCAFASALASTLMRIFQEMREDDGQIDWSALRDGRPPLEVIARLRAILSAYIERRSSASAARYDYIVDEMKSYIKAHYSEPIQLIDLSEEFNLSPKYCSEVFNRLSGENFKNYLNRFRINEAQRRIEEEPQIKVATLAQEVGFTSANTFIRVFDRYMGVTPGQYAETVLASRRQEAEGSGDQA